ncbi:MAG: VWA domain-containing protein, partial [Planctomycetota bacterium]
MSRHRFLLPAIFSLTTFVAATAWSVEPPARPTPAARLATFDQTADEVNFALSVSARLPETVDQGRDVVVLFDTSASQNGGFRADAMVALNSLLENLTPADRVKLYAVDLTAKALHSDFDAVDAEGLQAGLVKLSERVPLGSTDMVGALQTVVKEFSDRDSDNQHKAVIYVGDGVSRAKLLGTDTYGKLVKELVERRVSVSSYGVGPQVNLPLLASLANHTGGVVLAPENKSAQQIGAALASSVRATVAWPTKSEYPAEWKETFPSLMPPLRSDRDTILIGSLEGREAATLTVSVDVAGQSQELQWKLQPEASTPEFSFLPKLTEMARADEGLSLPTVGSEGLRLAGQALLSGAEATTRLGEQALAGGDRQGAAQAARAAIAADPANPTARSLLAASEKNDKKQLTAVQEGSEPLKLEGNKPAAPPAA